jgi:nitrogen fixation protein FixH
MSDGILVTANKRIKLNTAAGVAEYMQIMKLNWGTGIAIFYSLFVIVMAGMVVLSKSFDNSLVVDNYYEEDLRYQSHLDKVENSKGLANDLSIVENETEKSLRFQFPREISAVSGEILFYRPNDATKDFSIDIHPDEEGAVLVPTGKLLPGRWKVKVDWQGDGKAFYKEETVILN